MQRGVAILSILCAGFAFANEESVTRYDIIAKGITIGHAETIRSKVQRDGQALMRCRVSTKVDVDLLFVSCHIDGTEDVLVGPTGVVQFAISATKDGHHHATSGTLSNGVFHCQAVIDGTTNQVSVPRSDFAATTLDGLELQLRKGDPATTNRVFDCAQVKILDRSYRWVEDAVLNVGGSNRTFRVVEFEDAQKKGRRWVCTDEWGMVIARQEAKEPSGSYSLRLKECFTRPQATAVSASSTVPETTTSDARPHPQSCE